jgi:AraC family transcriptional regulator, transcriptional activator of pobA
MDIKIPTYSLQNVASLESLQQNVFFTDSRLGNLQTPLDKPYRSDYYGIGICIDGNATLVADLEKYNIQQNSIIAMSPQVVKQWIKMTDEYKTLTVFFKPELFVPIVKQLGYLEQFVFFQSNERHVINSENDNAIEILNYIHSIKNMLESKKAYYTEIVAHQICIVLYQLQSIFQAKNFTKLLTQTRSQQITVEFKKLVTQYFKSEHNVKFYAEKLFITTKHLSEIVKQETNKTAGEWIDDTIILEAKILLSNLTLTINEISFQLNFTDQSSFGKFFKNLTGLSPKEYRNAI